jgi:hypothetical protein
VAQAILPIDKPVADTLKQLWSQFEEAGQEDGNLATRKIQYVEQYRKTLSKRLTSSQHAAFAARRRLRDIQWASGLARAVKRQLPVVPGLCRMFWTITEYWRL